MAMAGTLCNMPKQVDFIIYSSFIEDAKKSARRYLLETAGKFSFCNMITRRQEEIMKRIKIGQIGIGHNHAEGIMLSVRKFPELFEVAGYAEENGEWMEKHGGLPCFQDLPRMTADELIERCDALLVETEIGDLTKTAAKCIRAGKHIHMDKPAGGTLEEYAALLNAAREKNLTIHLGYYYRYNDAMNKCRELAKNGALGEIYQIDAELSPYPAQYRKSLEHFPGGLMYIFGCHLIDLAVDILGEPKNVVPFLKSTHAEGVCAQDNCFAVLEYEKAVAKITTLSVEVNGWDMRHVSIMGSRGTAEIRPLETSAKMTVSLADKDSGRPREIEVVNAGAGCRYDRMMKDFYLVVTGAKKSPYSHEHELMLQRTLYRACGM